MNMLTEQPLGQLTSKIGSGATPTGGKQSYKSCGIPLIRSMNVRDFAFDWDGLAFIDDQQAKQLAHVTVTNGDVLVNITGASVARCCLAPSELAGARVNQHVAIIRSKPPLSVLSVGQPSLQRRVAGACGSRRNAGGTN